MKGLPLTYNRDMQEDKEPLFDSVDTLFASLRVMADMLGHTKVNRARCEAAASDHAGMRRDVGRPGQAQMWTRGSMVQHSQPGGKVPAARRLAVSLRDGLLTPTDYHLCGARRFAVGRSPQSPEGSRDLPAIWERPLYRRDLGS